MLLLRIDGGVHGGVHWSGEREVQRTLDLRAVRGGREGRDSEVGERHKYGRGYEASHKLLPVVQDIHSTQQSHRGIDRSRQTSLATNLEGRRADDVSAAG
ncbi:hypothetical protein G2W53_012390 [Senna tora]|uniref:Uncharacterized protein n=1 Tax=Senna tora TaxID=362788 RepID=A0A834TXL6_9FABA|nr:hypothetical protein G2W53_012390 [Senna tora]